MPEVNASAWLSKYCRTCASEVVAGGVDIFGNEGKRLGISEKLRKTLSVLVLEEDLLPKRICTDCCTSLEEYSQYKEAVFDAQEKLKAIAKTLMSNRKGEVNPPPPIPEPCSSMVSSGSRSATGSGSNCKDCGKKLENSICTENHQSPHDTENVEAVEDEPIAVHTEAEDTPETSDENDELSVEPKSIETSTIPEKFPCDFCSEIFADASTYYSHIASNHKGKRYQCSFCTLSYAQKVSLTVHIRSQHSVKETLSPKTHLCTTCPAAFYEKKELTRHAKTHITEREFPCYICNKFYKTSKCLSKHISSHLLANKFVCTVCQKGFNRKNRLEEHENTHNQMNSLGCPFCSKTFNNYPNYSKHLKRMHEKECVAGQRPPPPIKNTHTETRTVATPDTIPPPPATLSPAQPSSSSSNVVATSWVESTSVSRFNGMNATIDVNGGIQNSNGNTSVTVTTLSTSGVGGNHNVREMAPTHDPNQPMELCYKITSTDFQDMPMELTKVFQESGPLELCVRTANELSHLIDSTSSTSNKDSNTFKDLIDLSNVAPFQQQPMDLINRDSYSTCNLTSVNNSVDLSLRSSFSDQSTNSFIRELLDLSSRSEGYHNEPSHSQQQHNQNQMELNLSATRHSQAYRSGPAPAQHPVPNNFLNVYPDNLF